ncbi:hypothetical protein L9F63_019662, partial [Diploptera punctata]
MLDLPGKEIHIVSKSHPPKALISCVPKVKVVPIFIQVPVDKFRVHATRGATPSGDKNYNYITNGCCKMDLRPDTTYNYYKVLLHIHEIITYSEFQVKKVHSFLATDEGSPMLDNVQERIIAQRKSSCIVRGIGIEKDVSYRSFFLSKEPLGPFVIRIGPAGE